MNPIVVIGAGGSGKWIATDVKLAAIDMRNRELLREHGETARQRPDWNSLPPEIQVLAVDVSKSDHHPVVRRDAQHAAFSLDYSESSAEFVDISSRFGTVVEAISRGEGKDFPRISAWLSRSDASCYDIRRLPTINSDGAGQLRQLGRVSLFLALQGKQNLAQSIRAAIQRVNAAITDNSKVTVFVCGSLAGGTGSGILWDVAALARYYANDILRERYELVGCIVLPGAFRQIARAGAVENVRMAANAYAGLRELSRLMGSDNDTEFAYDTNLGLTLKDPIFSVAYLMEGSRPSGYDLAGDEPRYGTYPTVADTILLHSATTVDMSQVRTEMTQHPEGLFSVAGAVQWVLPVEDIIYEAGHFLSRLSIESLLWGQQATATVPPPAALQRAEVAAIPRRDEFLTSNSGASSPLVRFTDSFLVQQRTIQLSTSLMSQQLQFNNQNRDRPLPRLALADQIELGPRLGRGDPAATKQQAEQLVARVIGGETDAAAAGRKTVHAVLNHYREQHSQVFHDYLSDEVLRVLNSTETEAGSSVRPGGLLYAEAFLDAVRDRLETFRSRFVEVYDSQQRIDGSNTTRLERARQELSRAEKLMLEDRSRMGGRGRHADYLRRYQQVFDLTVQDRVHSAILDIIDGWGGAVGESRTEVSGWADTLRENIATLGSTVQEIQGRRRESGRIRSRRYVSQPGDEYENRLIRSFLKADDPNDQTKSEGVATLLRPMFWNWGSNTLMLHRQVEDDQPSGVRDWRKVLPEHTQRCFGTFARIREITIWDALKELGYDDISLRRELIGRIDPITNVDLEEQQRYPSVKTVAKNIVLADWQEPQNGDGPDSPRRLSQGVRDELGNDAVRWSDPHLILGVGQRHLVKMASLGCVPGLAPYYKRTLTGEQPIEGTERRLPLHLFPGESLAAEIELSSQAAFGRKIVVPAELVGLLQHERNLLDFALAIGFELIELHRDRRGIGDSDYWQANKVLLDDGVVADVPLGTNIYLACRTFLTPTSPIEKLARQSVADELTEQISGFGTDAEFVQKLRGLTRPPLLPEHDTAPENLRIGLDEVMRALIWRRAENAA